MFLLRGENQMKILSISVILPLIWLFVGCGEDVEETMDGSEDKSPDVATVTGKATLAGENNHSGIGIYLYRDESLVNQSETDASGNYSIGLRKTGDYILKFEEDRFVTVTQEITIAEGANSAAPVTLEPGGVIAGTVDFDVKPPDKPQLKVTIINEANGQESIVKPDRGRYRVTVLPGTYTVIAEDAAPDSRFPSVEQEGVEVKVGDIISMDALLSTWPYFEAEDATVIKAPMTIDEDPGASGGKYVLGVDLGYAIFDIMIPEDGDYIIWGRALAKDGGSDSFLVGVNVDEPANTWDVPQGAWTWDRVSNRNGPDPVIFEMLKGKNSIVFKTRESNTKLDKIFLTTSPSAQP
jgi:hypothetical protein